MDSTTIPPEVVPLLCTLVGASWASAVSAYRLAKKLRATAPIQPRPAATQAADRREVAAA